MEQLQFDIHHGDGRRESTVVNAARIVIGSGAHCDVRLAADQAALEHVVIEVRLDGTFAASVAASPAALLDGQRFDVVELKAPTVTLQIASSRVVVTRATPVETRSKKPSALAIAKLALIPLLAVATAAMGLSETKPTTTTVPKTPPVFSSASATCPRADRAEARAAGDERRAIADGARERSPFDPREAIAAVASYEAAAACYRTAGAGEAAEEAAEAARRLRETTELDVRARRIRLERVLVTKDYELAAQDVVVLRAVSEKQDGPYQQWLAGIAKEVTSQPVEKSR